MHWLTDPLSYEFMQRALIVAVLDGALCGMIGVYVVLRRMSYIGHGLSHAILGGAVVGYVLGWNFYLVAGVWGFVAAMLINQVTRRRQIGADAAIGIVTTASFAFGVALISRGKHFTRNFEAALFGNLLGISQQDMLLIAATTLVMILVVFLFYKQLLFMTFDPDVAPAYGVPGGTIDTLFALMLAATIIVSIKIMGVTLIAASLVIPPVIARLLTNSFSKIIVLSTVLGAFTGFTGIYISYYQDIASGAAIVLLAAAIFAVVLVGSLVRQWVPQARVSRAARPPARRISVLPQDLDVH